MTQDVQPLTWQKRTNIEEHMQFFSKINEIIDNLAPTVEEAEQAIAQATAAIADANAAIATANAASAAADAAALQAQTAAATVAGYNTRLTAVEGEAAGNTAGITALQGRMGTAEGNITALQNVQADYVKKAGAAQTVTSQIMVPTTATGTRDTQIANGTRIQNDLDAYQPMVRTTGNQDIDGLKNMIVPMDGGYMLFNQVLSSFPADTYVRIYRGLSYSQTHLLIYGTQANNGLGFIDIMVGGSDQYDRSYLISKFGVFNASGFDMLIVQMTNYTEVWIKRISGIGYLSAVVTHAMREFVKTNVVAGTGLTAAPAIGDTNPITSETIMGLRVVS